MRFVENPFVERKDLHFMKQVADEVDAEFVKEFGATVAHLTIFEQMEDMSSHQQNNAKLALSPVMQKLYDEWKLTDFPAKLAGQKMRV